MKILNLDVMKRLEEKSRSIRIVAQYVANIALRIESRCYLVPFNSLFQGMSSSTEVFIESK